MALFFTYSKYGIRALVRTYSTIYFSGDSLVVSAILLPRPLLRVLYAGESAAGQKCTGTHLRQETSRRAKHLLWYLHYRINTEIDFKVSLGRFLFIFPLLILVGGVKTQVSLKTSENIHMCVIRVF